MKDKLITTILVMDNMLETEYDEAEKEVKRCKDGIRDLVNREIDSECFERNLSQFLVSLSEAKAKMKTVQLNIRRMNIVKGCAESI